MSQTIELESLPAADAAAIARLRQPLTLPCGQVLPNRIAKAAMTEGLADARMNATPALDTLYRRWSFGGAGLLITGNVQIDRWDVERPGNVVIDGDADQAALARWAQAARAAGNQVWMQLSHAGRQAPSYCSPRPVAASAVRLDLLGAYRTPRALLADQIDTVIDRFVRAATVARACGFTGVQIHAAHGYLLSGFLSSVTNRRDDGYGGGLENRARLLLEIARAVRAAVGPDFAVAVKLNSADFQQGGFSHAECRQVVRWLNDCALDLLEISGGSYEQPRMHGHTGDAGTLAKPTKATPSQRTQRKRTRQREAYFLDYAALIRRDANMPLMVTGGFRSRAAMASALATGKTDVIGLGRPLCADPRFVARLFEGTTDRAADPGSGLAYGRGLFGLGSRITSLRFINIVSQMGWYYVQLMRMGRGREPDWRMPLWRGLFGHVKAELTAAWRIRAFQKESQSLERRAP